MWGLMVKELEMSFDGYQLKKKSEGGSIVGDVKVCERGREKKS